MPVDHALDVAGLLIDLRQQDYDDGEALTHRPALPTPSPKSSSIADLAQAVKAQGCGYETSDSQLKRRAPDGGEEVNSIEEKHLKRMRRNRESAAMSRNRKKNYIEELEAKGLQGVYKRVRRKSKELLERLTDGTTPVPPALNSKLLTLTVALEPQP